MDQNSYWTFTDEEVKLIKKALQTLIRENDDYAIVLMECPTPNAFKDVRECKEENEKCKEIIDTINKYENIN